LSSILYLLDQGFMS